MINTDIGNDGTPSVIQGLISRFAPPEDDFVVTIAGVDLKFHARRSYEDIRDMERDAYEFQRKVKAGEIKNLVAYKECSPETLAMVYVLNSTSIEPKLSQIELCDLATRAGNVFKSLTELYDDAQVTPVLRAEMEELQKQKKNLSSTISDE